MIVETLSNRARLTAAAANRAGRLAWRKLLRTRLLRWRYRGEPIDRLLLTPQDLRTGDPSFASEIYHGHFGLAGVVALPGTDSPFAISPPSEAWERELHGFGWLRHLHAAHDEISREHARALVGDWIALHGEPRGLAWEPEITARRIISWLSHTAILLEGTDVEFYETLMRSFAFQFRYLRSVYDDANDGLPRLIALIALAFAGLCADEKQPSSLARTKTLADELRRQILADGGHISRNPAVLIELLLDLLPLRQCFIARDQTPPPELLAAIDRMMPMLRFFRLGDHSFARFNAMGATPMESLAALMVHDEVQGKPVPHAENSGYCRLESGSCVIIADTGRAPPIGLSADAHAGCLSFEMSAGRHPLIVNCGAPVHDDPEWRYVSRTTAAHSTLIVSDTLSAQFVGAGLVLDGTQKRRLSGPVNVQANLSADDGIVELRASHDGYDQKFGITHIRRLCLTLGGELLEGTDQLLAPHGLKGAARDNGAEYAIRFHLHPTARAALSKDGRSVLISLPDRDGWRMTNEQGQLTIEESVFLADVKGPLRSAQIVIHGAMGSATDISIRWSLERVAVDKARDRRAGMEQAGSGELPLGG